MSSLWAQSYIVQVSETLKRQRRDTEHPRDFQKQDLQLQDVRPPLEMGKLRSSLVISARRAGPRQEDYLFFSREYWSQRKGEALRGGGTSERNNKAHPHGDACWLWEGGAWGEGVEASSEDLYQRDGLAKRSERVRVVWAAVLAAVSPERGAGRGAGENHMGSTRHHPKRQPGASALGLEWKGTGGAMVG